MSAALNARQARAALTLAALLASQSQAACLWTDPGASRFTGDPVVAVNSYADIPPQARAELAEAVGQRAYSEVVDITRSAIGAGRYTHMRAMHWGAGQQCLGDVDRSAWPADRVERGLVYCVRGHCVIVPTVCGNVARVNRAGVLPQPDPAGLRVAGMVADGGIRAPRSVPEPGTALPVLVALAVLAVFAPRKG